MPEARRHFRVGGVHGWPAFSLVELVIVLVILSAISAIAIPRYSDQVDRYRLDATRNRIAADLEYARSIALAESRSVKITFDEAAESYQIDGAASLKGAGTAHLVDLTEEPYRADISGVSFDDPTDGADPLNELTFDGFGQPDSGGKLTVQAGGVSGDVVVDGDTGEITVP
ncbi:MAG: GspH/FimT family pseudopilin [Phycisphaerales bacterium]